MRRLIAYTLLSASLILGCAAVATPTIVAMDTDISYGYGRDLVFKISPYDEENVNGIDPAEEGVYIDDDNYVAVDAVAEEMTDRLDDWGIADYTVTKEGYDTIRVRLRTENNSDLEYDYLAYYLPFSGGHISVAASMDQEDDYAYDSTWEDLFTDNEAEIEYINDDTTPVVVIEVNSEGEEGALGTLIEYCESKYEAADESASTEEVNCYVALWTNKQDTDTFDAATGNNSTEIDENVASRFLGAENSSLAWFEEDEEDDNYTRFQFVPSSASYFNSSISYDSTDADAAYKAAYFYMSLFNASDYADIGAGYDVTFSFSTVASAEVEDLVDSGYSLTPAMSATLIATIVGFAIAIIVLALFYRMGALAAVASMLVTLIATMLLVVYFHAQFGAGMLLGLVAVALLSIFGSIYYFAKLKDEIYKGRSLKKAHQEATKKAFWPILDGGILSIVTGLCIYFLVPAETSMAGLVLVIGGFFATICSLLLTRVLMWLFCNDGDSATKVGGLLGIDKAKVPDLLKDEKQTHFGLFADTNFMKPWKWTAIIGGVLLVASIVGLSVFSGINDGSPFATSSDADGSRAYISYRIAEDSTNDVFNGLDDIDNGTDGVLNLVYIDDTMLSEYATDIQMVTTTITLTNSVLVDDGDYTVLNFVIDFEEAYGELEGEYVVKLTSGQEETFDYLEDALAEALESLNVDVTAYSVSVKNIVYEEITPSFTDISIGICVSLIVIGVYLSLRYKPSRGIPATLFAGAATFIALGILCLTRITATPIAALGAVAVLFVATLLSIYILGKEKEIVAESRERDKTTLEFRAKSLLDANSQGAAELIIFGIIAAYFMVAYLAFGPSSFSLGYAVALVGIIVAIALVLILIVPFSLFLAKQFTKIHLDAGWKNRKKKKSSGKKSSEPEEAIFIGIND